MLPKKDPGSAYRHNNWWQLWDADHRGFRPTDPRFREPMTAHVAQYSSAWFSFFTWTSMRASLLLKFPCQGIQLVHYFCEAFFVMRPEVLN
ncbi:hypothetical protein HPB47_009136 [Ixodes persulcatus]|uniref:Uncharacterized protein n=1 Tax=Ixodes persulcatus TaxID=34615 RepID=A0AC60P2R1_IXOPE|nr:hypothetical protein HPB47_009136 [Ixodes persulcatus]